MNVRSFKKLKPGDTILIGCVCSEAKCQKFFVGKISSTNCAREGPTSAQWGYISWEREQIPPPCFKEEPKKLYFSFGNVLLGPYQPMDDATRPRPRSRFIMLLDQVNEH